MVMLLLLLLLALIIWPVSPPSTSTAHPIASLLFKGLWQSNLWWGWTIQLARPAAPSGRGRMRCRRGSHAGSACATRRHILLQKL